MHILINREALLAPLQAIAGMVERKQTMPVLSNVLMVASENGLTITGTNMEVELVCDINQVEILQTGSITVPARKLSDICRSLPDQTMLDVSIESDRFHLRSGKSHFTLATLPAEQFPNIEESSQDQSITVLQGDFKKLLDASSFAMAQQDVRYYLNGMLIEIGDNFIRSVATDGHRLAMSTLATNSAGQEKRQVIVPRKGVLELSRLLADPEQEIQIALSESHIRSKIGCYTFTSKLIEGKFPDYNRVIPRGGDKVVIANRKELKAVFARAAILSHENIRGVRLQISDNLLQVFANNTEQEQAEDSVGVTYYGESLQIGFNVGYLIDVLNNISSDEVKMTLSNANASALVESTESHDALYVVMPMRI
ncbi:MAG: DNA polymerase III subunit beta [Hahellaceae bacterium]|nr:DNA polymerase III subunit beta [Hahellaceae bacterium]